ncbi:MAG: Asp-tRNA(Asn)/Glu-tRNA(Gln) amidotransferase subunit GatB [Bacillota bacterium]
MKYETVIGMEIHVELSTKTKMFCNCANAFGAEENTLCCPVCIGLPGTLPVINKTAVDYCIMAGLATNCEITRHSLMDRKNYHYPDLTKGFQTSQLYYSLCRNGHVEIETDAGTKRIGILEIHMEEDAGKLVHPDGQPYSRVDYNRAGVPLIEIVTAPDMRSAEEGRVFLETLRNILLSLGVSDCKMQEGSLRCDVNISVRPEGSEKLGTRAEIKNLNSFRSVMRAIEYEAERQIDLIEGGGQVVQQTRRWDDAAGATSALRSKEDSHDYRYFPEPDLMPIVVDDEWIERIRAKLPELPESKRLRYEKELGLPGRDARMLSSSRTLSKLLESAMEAGAPPRAAGNWLVGDLMRMLKDRGMDSEEIRFTGEDLAALIALIDKGTISSTAGRQVLEGMLDTGKQPAALVEELGLKQISDADALIEIVREIVRDNPKPAADYRAGKEKAMAFFTGQAMKRTKGKANPVLLQELFANELKK